MGDCIYDYSSDNPPTLRKSIHSLDNMNRDLRGQFSLLSKHFYYFGDEPRPLPQELKKIIRRGRKHLVFDDPAIIKKFEEWISTFTKNKCYSEPQLKFQFELESSNNKIEKCGSRCL